MNSLQTHTQVAVIAASSKRKISHAIGTCQTLAYAIARDHRLLRRSSPAAIEDDGGIKTVTNSTYRENIMHHVDPCSTSHPKAV